MKQWNLLTYSSVELHRHFVLVSNRCEEWLHFLATVQKDGKWCAWVDRYDVIGGVNCVTLWPRVKESVQLMSGADTTRDILSY